MIHLLNVPALLVRVGWMELYNGTAGERPVGGGKYNKKNIGHEAFNFKKVNNRLYGYFQPQMAASTVALERVSPKASEDTIDDVLVIYVATSPHGHAFAAHGQVVVGWYKKARLYRAKQYQAPERPSGWGYFCVAKEKDCVLLPSQNRQFTIPAGKGGFGQTNVCYLRERNGAVKRQNWIQDCLTYVRNYDGPQFTA